MDRLDVYLMKNNLVRSREKAIEFIKLGAVKVNGQVVYKPSTKVDDSFEIEIDTPYEFVGRGGLKLQKLVEENIVSFEGLVCLDIGASTGGFTDCMLKDGASHVTSLDVGSGELDESLRTDKRVLVMENTDIRYVEKFPTFFDAITIDVSFISLKKVLPKALEFIKEDGYIAALIKPQFEVGPGVAKKGIVKNRKEHIRILKDIQRFIEKQSYNFSYLSHSPIRGGKGNIEYITIIRKNSLKIQFDINQIVEDAFRS